MQTQPKTIEIPRRLIGVACGILCVGILLSAILYVYSPALKAPFVYDDFPYIVNNDVVHLKSLDWESLTGVLEGKSPDRFVAMLSFALNHYWSGLDSQAYRLVNLAIHALNGLFVFVFIRQLMQRHTFVYASTIEPLTARVWVPLGVLLLWCFHPLHIQSVTYVSQRMNSLGALFFLVSICCYSFVRTATHPIIRKLFYFLCGFAALCAWGSKQNTATLPVFIFLYEWIFFQAMNRRWLLKQLKWLWLLALPAGVLFLIISPEEWWQLNSTEYLRWLTAWRANVHYLGLLIFPEVSRLNFDYDPVISRSWLDPWTTFASLIFMLSLGGLALYAYYRRWALLAFSLTWYLGNLVIESNYVRYDIICDYRTYLPSTLLLLPLVTGMARFKPWVVLSACIGVSLLFGNWTYQRNQVWADDLTLWQDNVAKAPGKARIWNNLAYAWHRRGNFDNALKHYQHALKLDPARAETYGYIADTLMRLGRHRDALEYYRTAYGADPTQFSVNNDFAGLLHHLGYLNEALPIYLDNLKLRPYHKFTYNNLGVLYKQIKLYEEAHEKLNRALELDPDYIDAVFNKGFLYYEQKQYGSARIFIERCLRLNPNHARAQAILVQLPKR